MMLWRTSARAAAHSLGWTLLAATISVSAAEPAYRLAGAPGPAGELPAHTPYHRGAADAGLRIDLRPAPWREKRATAKATSKGAPLRIGFHRDVPKAFQGDLLRRLAWVTTSDGGLVATLFVSSPQAKSIRIGFRARLPAGAALRFFHPDGDERNVPFNPVVTREDLRPVPAGAPTAAKSSSEAQAAEPDVFWSPSVRGDTIGIEVALPDRSARQHASLRLEKIAHRFADADTKTHLDASLFCSGHINVQCRADRFQAGLQDAVALLEFEDALGSSQCTGTLMNDRDPTTFVPYVITANHCVADGATAGTVQATWFHQHPSCDSEVLDGRTTSTFGGADLLATMSAEDATLIRLRRRVPPGVFFSGWDTTPAASGDAVYGIHHPRRAVKKYAAGAINGIANVRISGRLFRNALRVSWSEGATEGGSSGSGLFRNDLLIGMLSGGNFCSIPYDYYGSFESVFSQFCSFLSPQSCGDQNVRDRASASVRISTTAPTSLTEANLDNATVTVALTNTTFGSGVTKESFTLTTNVPGLSIDSVSMVAAGDSRAMLTLDYDGTDFDTARTLSVTVAAAAHAGTADLTTAAVSVSSVLDVTVSRTTLSLNEDPGTTAANVGSYTVALEAAPAATTTVAVASADAAVTVDGDSTTRTLTFTTANWSTPQTVTATARQDDDAVDEAVAVTHAAAGHGVVATVTVAVADDDAGTVVLDADPTTDEPDPGPLAATEGASSNARYTVRLSAAPAATTTVAVASSDAGAATASPTTLTFTTANWSAAQTVEVAAQSDLDALDESVTLAHTASGGGYNGTTARLRVAVSDDERTGTDYDTDEDGLIEVASLAQLNAVRWDLDGDGAAAAAATGTYASAFPNASAGMGCPAAAGAAACKGYELAADLDFDTDGDGATHTGRRQRRRRRLPRRRQRLGSHRPGVGAERRDALQRRLRRQRPHHLQPVREPRPRPLGAVRRVRQRRAGDGAGAGGRARARTAGDAVGALAGRNLGRISAAWSTGSVSGAGGVGGLVGVAHASSTIVASYSRASVTCAGTGARRAAGGLAASNAGAVAASYASGAVTSATCREPATCTAWPAAPARCRRATGTWRQAARRPRPGARA